jgi:RNA polymerase sigma-70 factor (ECF subfamily)
MMAAVARVEGMEPADGTSPSDGRAERPRQDGARFAATDERDLLLRHRAGDASAFAELVAAYRAPVYSYLARCGVAPDDRDDLFQDVFVKIHRAAPSYRPERPVHPWIFTIVGNTVRTHLRKQRVRQLVFARTGAEAAPVDSADPSPGGERRSVARQTLAVLEEEIRKLPLPQREVMLLAGVEKLALKEVARIVGIPVNTVKTHLRRARLALARALARRDRGTEVPI